MKKKDKLKALKALAREYIFDYCPPTIRWKNPLNPKSRGILWTEKDYKIFEKFQLEYQQKGYYQPYQQKDTNQL